MPSRARDGLQMEDITEDGLEKEFEPEGDEIIVQPFDPTKSKIDTKPLSIDLLVRRIENNEIDLAPAFQRKGELWTPEQQSRLIESLLIRIPLPAFYFDATTEDKWVVVDGLQRLTAFYNIILKNQPLRKLEFLTEYNDKTYKQLPRRLQRRVEESTVTVHLIQAGTPSDVKFNIFKRINTGGLVLTAQEIRNALNQGPITELLEKLANSSEFKKATDGTVPTRRMQDREFALRFLSFTIIPPSEYKRPDLDGFLSEAMTRLNTMPGMYPQLEQRFRQAMVTALKIFGHNAFRKQYTPPKDYRYPVNKALFDCWSVSLGALDDRQSKILVERRDDVNARLRNLISSDPDFVEAITTGTKDTRRVHYRFKCVQSIVASILKEANLVA